MRVKADDEGSSRRVVFRVYKDHDPDLFQVLSSYSTQSLNKLAASLLTQYFMTQRATLGGLAAPSLPVQRPVAGNPEPEAPVAAVPRKEKPSAPRAPVAPAAGAPAPVTSAPVLPVEPAATPRTEPVRPAAAQPPQRQHPPMPAVPAQTEERPAMSAPAAPEPEPVPAAEAPISRVELAPAALRSEPARPAAPAAAGKSSASRQRWLQTAT